MKFAACDWPTLSALFDQALELPAESRTRWLADLPIEQREFREALRRLLTDHAQVESQAFMGTLPKLEAGALAQPGGSPGLEVGPYRLLHEIGRGGMGTVWLAERSDGVLKRPVALKLPHPGLATRVFAERLERERDILGSMAHPHIARLYDAGVTAEGQPYIALEYVPGRTLIEHCQAAGLGLRQRIRLFQQVLEAVQYAHAHLVIHRDLKPSNVLVDDDGQVRLLDFGIAKLLVDGQAQATELTLDGGQALTPDYASPEQLAGSAITTASDVYSLGVLMYELLAGTRPYSLRNERDLARAVRELEIARPSDAKTAGRDAKALRGDLDTIVLKALKHAPAERYATVEAMQQDIERHLNGERVLARPDSTWLRTVGFLRRHRTGAMVAALLVLALAGGLAGTTWQALEARRQADIARSQARTALAAQQFMASVFHANSGDQSDPQKARDMTARQLLDVGAGRIDKDLRDAPEARLSLLKTLAEMYEDMGLLDEAAELSGRRVALARQTSGERSEPSAQALVGLGESLTNLDRLVQQAWTRRVLSWTHCGLRACRRVSRWTSRWQSSTCARTRIARSSPPSAPWRCCATRRRRSSS
jgi:eukaryotic-like serine/threonine-protein kinase